MMDNDELESVRDELNKLAPNCPRCGAKMVLVDSSYWRCSSQRCQENIIVSGEAKVLCQKLKRLLDN